MDRRAGPGEGELPRGVPAGGGGKLIERLRWDLRYAGAHDHLVHEWEKGIRNELADQPEVHPDLQPVLDAWIILSRAKRNPDDPIPISEVLAFLDVRCIMDLDLRREYVELVTQLDSEFRKLRRNPDPSE